MSQDKDLELKRDERKLKQNLEFIKQVFEFVRGSETQVVMGPDGSDISVTIVPGNPGPNPPPKIPVDRIIITAKMKRE